MSENLKIATEQNLYDMLKDHEIVIPIIQRDYAQGRDNENVKEIRENFITDIFSKLSENKKLKLSFVYGTEEGNQYVPYDGQQRLTLVFLLLYYLSKFSQNHLERLSNFSYRTRDFSSDFCKYLTSNSCVFKNNPLEEIDTSENTLKETIINDINFFSAWLSDPTVYSMINVLQTIHILFNKLPLTENVSTKKEQAEDFLQKLQDGYIFFDWCTLNASDSIYVKMNGRGKTLSAFDNFKNTLYGVLNQLREKESDEKKLKFLTNFEQKLDSDWTDLFWRYRSYLFDNNEENVNIAPAMMNFIYFLFEYKYVAKSKKFFFGKGETVRWLDENKIVSFLSIFKSAFTEEILNIDDYIWISKCLDILSLRLKNETNLPINNAISNRSLFDEKEIFIALCKQLKNYDYESHITAAFYYSYMVQASLFDENGSLIMLKDDYKQDWAEFIVNINQTVQFFNSHFNDLVNDKKIYITIESFVNKVFAISSTGDLVAAVTGINQEDIDEWKTHFVPHSEGQFQEEIEKLKLRSKEHNWTNAISQANNIPYFNGQIYFLIEASKDSNGIPNISLFTDYSKAASLLVNDNLKLIDDNTLRCILLSFGDYRIDSKQGYSNACSLCESSVSGTAKYFLWKSFFDIFYSQRQDFVKKLLNEIKINNFDINATLQTCRNNSTANTWEGFIVRYPEILQYIGEFGVVDTLQNSIPYVITSDGVKKLVREEHIDSFAININLYGIYRSLGFNDDGNISTNLRDIWDLPTGQSIKQTSSNTFSLLENGNTILADVTIDTIIANAKHN